MKVMKRFTFAALSLLVILSFIISGCAAKEVVKTVVVEKAVQQTVQVEKVVQQTVEVEKVVKETSIVEKVVKETQIVEVVATAAPVDTTVTAETLPRNETLYFNGQQWGPVVCWNPYVATCNNALAIGQADSARVIMFETPYLYDMLDGNQYPLLADGDWAWNDAMTEITFKIKAAAKWSDGTPVTAEDVAYTWASHVKYNTPTASGNKDYIDTIEAVDAQTVVIKAKLNAEGKTVNPLAVKAYVSSNYVLQKAWTQKLEERAGGDA